MVGPALVAEAGERLRLVRDVDEYAPSFAGYVARIAGRLGRGLGENLASGMLRTDVSFEYERA